MITQPGLSKGSVLKKFVIESHPIIQTYIQRLKIPDLIATYIVRDHRLKLPVDRSISLLIHNILTTPKAMYEIAGWVKALDEGCLGLEPGDAAFINDDRVGEDLERFYHGRHKDVFFHLALRAIKVFELDCSQIHQDTTSITFCGRYEGWSVPERLTHGLNKDHRPDLKQLVLGLSVSADGAVPLTHTIYSGNQSDDTLHPQNHQRLRQLLKRSDFIYVADCKLATQTNLRRIAGCGGRFVSIMPRTWKEDAQFRKRVCDGQVQWVHLLSRRNNRKPDSKIDRYDLAEGTHVVNDWRLLWIRSTQKAGQDAQTRQRHLDKAIESLQALQARLNTYRLKNLPAIQTAIAKILKEQEVQGWIDWRLNVHREVRRHHPGRGRPKASDQPTLSWQERFCLTFEVNQQAIQRDALCDGVFPIITNLAESDYTARRVLEIYKFQPFLEKRHSQLKTWQEVTPVLLKKSQRVIAYLHVHIMALTVASLMERQLRKAMKRHGIDALPIYPEDKPCPAPTMFDIARLFQGVERFEVLHGDQLTLFPAKLTPLQKQVLEMLEVPASLYQ